MSRVLRLCFVLLSVYSVTGQKQIDYNRSQSMSPSYSVKVDIVTDTSGYSTSRSHRVRRQLHGRSLSRSYYSHWYRFPFGYERIPPREQRPKEDPWPDRPHTLNGSSEEFPLPKCCYKYSHLQENLRKCDYERVQLSPRPWLKLPLNESQVRFPTCPEADMLRLGSVEAFDKLSFSERGTLLLRVSDLATGSRQVELDREAACADVVLGDKAPFGVVLCPCERTVCVRKCCGKTQALVVREASVATVETACKEMTIQEAGTWKLKIEPWPKPHNDSADKKGYITLPGSLPTKCKRGLTRAPPSWATPEPGKDFRVYIGLAVINTSPEKHTDDFCVDGERLSNGSLSPSIVFCADPITVPMVDRWMAVVGVVGVLALAAAVLVHVLLPELRATPFGRAMMTYSAALLAVALVGLEWTLNPDTSSFLCLFNITWTQYFLQAAAFWLNVMCYDIGIAFSSYKGALDKTGKAARRRYLRYAQYAWGCPFITVIPVVALQYTHQPGSPWRPIEWFMKCHYSSSLVQLLFLYTPLFLLFILNCAIFVWTAYRIRLLQKGSDILTDSDSNDESPYPPRKRLLLFLKLLWLMGVGETVLELIAWSVSAKALWYTGNVVDLSRSLCVFWLSCCKGTVVRRLRERFRDRLCCEALRRGSRVGPDSAAEAATAVAAAGTRPSDATDSTAIFSVTNTDPAAQRPNPETAAGDASWNAKSTQAAQAGISTPPKASVATSQNGIFKRATTRGVIEKEAEKDSEPPPGGIEMKVISTSSL